MAIRGLVEVMKDGNPCELQTGSIKEPNYSNESYLIICGGKYIEITALQSSQLNGGTPTLTIYEWICVGSA